MKEFRKSETGLFISEECNKLFSLKQHLSKHIKRFHKGQKEYFDKWIKDENEGYCKTCGKELKFIGFKYGYRNTCCKKCKYEYNYSLYIERYGEHPLKNKEKEKQTKLKRYKNENYNNRNKSKETCLKKYNVEHVFQSKIVKNKISNIKKERYGDSGYNNREKARSSGFRLKQYKDTDIKYRGSYELDFLEKYYNQYPEIKNASFIKYFFNKKEHIYFPDFYIASKNLIIEIKNSYLVKRDKKQLKAKEKATIFNGFNYIMIVDKDYIKFNSIITNLKTLF